MKKFSYYLLTLLTLVTLVAQAHGPTFPPDPNEPDPGTRYCVQCAWWDWPCKLTCIDEPPPVKCNYCHTEMSFTGKEVINLVTNRVR